MAGIIDTIKLASTLVLAIPAALAGLEFLLVRGETTTGAILLVLAVGLVGLQHWIPTPGDIPGMFAKRVLGSVVKEPEPDPEPNDEQDS
ncbi:DUF7533 family protein [Halopiger aswanensis]|uniref:Uncharacterized protein n=1 Tax=Halopiger aswanensis TaxID=148449 RepID=A0A3R7E2A8_9EURY|nr:hypothetical protein [Halopiger aswanensis]RKD98435.1 hypothetical protein ATJ93_1442 [Halopiger aswanensis]